MLAKLFNSSGSQLKIQTIVKLLFLSSQALRQCLCGKRQGTHNRWNKRLSTWRSV